MSSSQQQQPCLHPPPRRRRHCPSLLLLVWASWCIFAGTAEAEGSSGQWGEQDGTWDWASPVLLNEDAGEDFDGLEFLDDESEHETILGAGLKETNRMLTGANPAAAKNWGIGVAGGPPSSVPDSPWLRIHDNHVAWSQIEPSRGEYNWDRMDAIMREGTQGRRSISCLVQRHSGPSTQGPQTGVSPGRNSPKSLQAVMAATTCPMPLATL